MAARTANATCSSASQWMDNAQGDDPCKIASALLGKCQSNGVYYVPPTSTGLPYLPPSKQQVNPCQCNTVAYSLMSACAVCQDGTFPDFITWTSNCPPVLVEYQGYPNQTTSNLNVPSYAFLPLTSNNEFNVAGAKALATTPTSSSQTTSTMTSFLSTTLPTSASAVSAASTSAIGINLEIVIAVVVGLTLFLGLAGCFLFYRYRRGRSYHYRPLFTHRNRPTQSMLSKTPDLWHEVETIEDRPVSARTRVMSYFRRPRNAVQFSPYGQKQLPHHVVASTHSSNLRSQTQMQTQPYGNEAKIVQRRRVSLWTIILSNLGLRRNSSRSNESQATSYEKVQLPNSGVKSPSPSNLVSQTQMPMPTYKSMSPSVPGSPYQPILKSPRPQPTRIDTLPIMQTISRLRPEPRRSYSSNFPEASSFPREDFPQARPPEGVKNIPRPADFKIEETPTTTDGYPASWRRKRPPIRRDFFNPEISSSVSSLGSFSSISSHRNGDGDSDSVLLISRSGINFDIASISSKARSVVPSVLSKARSVAPSISSKARNIAPSVSKQSFSETSVGDSSRSMAGSSVPPMSPAVSHGYRGPLPDSAVYGTPEARESLFPASVRAAGYTGLPSRNLER